MPYFYAQTRPKDRNTQGQEKVWQTIKCRRAPAALLELGIVNIIFCHTSAFQHLLISHHRKVSKKEEKIREMNNITALCVNAPVYSPLLPQNNTGACMSLNTPQTLPLLESCCPSSSVYIHNTTLTTNGTEECSYIVCEVTGYKKWQSVASCLGRSVIVEGDAQTDQKQGDNVDPDSVRACAFNGAGVNDGEMTSMAKQRRIKCVSWGLLAYGLLGMLLVAGWPRICKKN